MASINGTIKRLVSDKGFGFILAGDGFDYFFHNSGCPRTASMTCVKGKRSRSISGRGQRGRGARTSGPPEREGVRASA